jgi:H/ACA ribonucleoprotein complex subunit 3
MKILKCANCGAYTLKESCMRCGGVTNRVRPAKFSPEDRYGKYRRMMKAETKQ